MKYTRKWYIKMFCLVIAPKIEKSYEMGLK